MADHVGDRAGQQYGHYRLLRLLGKGGFAEVYLGEHIYLNTQAAIKVLHTQLARDEQDNFLNEARVIARLVHPNIVRVLDFGMQGEQPFLVMDFAPNGSLRDRHPRGIPLPFATVVSYIKQMAAALHYAHHEKLVHRDVKPENMLVGRNSEILLGDFGISVVSQSSQSQHTQEVVGSIPYMAPEQLQGKPRPATDQYALAVITYEWLTGERPFQGGFTEMYAQHLFTPPPPPRTKNPNVSPEVEQVVLIGLAKDPHQRFADVQAFARALEQAGSGKQAIAMPPQHNASIEADAPQFQKASFHAQTTFNAPPTSLKPDNVITDAPTNQAPFSPPQGPASPLPYTVPTPQEPASYPQVQQMLPEGQKPVKRHLPRRAVVGGLIGLAAVAGAGGIFWSGVTRPQLPATGTIITRYTKHSDAIYTLAWNANQIASAGKDTTVQIWDANSGQVLYTYHNHTTQVNAVAWSPDGDLIASGASTVCVWDPSDGQTSTNFTQHNVGQYDTGIIALAWSPDAQFIASIANNKGNVLVWDASNGKLHETYKGHGGSFGFSKAQTVAWAHNNNSLIASGGNDDTVQLWNSQNGKTIFTYNKQNTDIPSIAWSPDNQSIASAGGSKVNVWDTTAGAAKFTLEGHSNDINDVAWSPDGKYLATASKDKTVRVWDATTGKPIATYSHHKDVVHAVRWADDSRRLASAGNDMQVIVWVAV